MKNYISEILWLLGDSRRKLPLLLLVFLMASTIDLAGIGLVGPYITLVVDPTSLDGDLGDLLVGLGLPRDQNTILTTLGVLLLVIFTVKAFVAILINRAIVLFSLKQQVNLRLRLMNSYQHMPYTTYLDRNSSEYIYNLHDLTQKYSSQVLIPLFRTISDSLVALAILAMLAWQDPVALGILVVLLGFFILTYDGFFRNKIRLYGKKANESATTLLQGVNEGIEGLKEIRVLGKEDYFFDVVERESEQYAFYNARTQILGAVPRYLLEVLMIGFVVSLVVGSMMMGQDLKTLIPTLGMFGVAALRLLPSANMLSNSLILLRYGRDIVTRLHEDLTALSGQDKGRASNATSSEVPEFQSLRLTDVGFAYPGARRKALDGISIDVQEGESIGLIGPSGSGKTTLVDVLLGILEPQEGAIVLNGKVLDADGLREWRNTVAYLPQQIFLIDDTLRKNIALGIQDDDIDDDYLNEVIRKARLDQLVSSLPDGVNTLIGERGIRLSGGQRQRIELARAFYHERRVLVMDEATSALDNQTEREIVEEIQQLKGEKTMIVIAHRLTTLRHCDRIIELKDGVVAAEGSYEELIGDKAPSH